MNPVFPIPLVQYKMRSFIVIIIFITDHFLWLRIELKQRRSFGKKNDTTMKTLKSIKAEILRDLDLLLKSRHQEL